jgi:molybdopterin-guanine dinucleotide biosynthesis protein A
VESLRDAGEDVDLRDPGPPLAGVVLCGGRSVRMGTDKASTEVGGVTLLDRAVTRLGDVCDPVLVAPGDVAVDGGAYVTVVDAVRDAGPLAGFVAALRASPHRLLAVVAVDLPWLDPVLLRMLAGWIADHDVAVCETARGIEPLHAVYARSALATAERALQRSDRSMHGLIERVRTVRVTEGEWRAAGISQRFSRNVNTPADLAELNLELRRPVS